MIKLNKEIELFISDKSGLKNLIIQSINELSKRYNSFKYEIKLIEDPNENYKQVCVNIKSKDKDYFEKYELFVEEWLVNQESNINHIVFDLI